MRPASTFSIIQLSNSRVITFFFHETGSFRTFIIRKNAGQSNREFPERYCGRKKEEEEGFLPEGRCVTL